MKTSQVPLVMMLGAVLVSLVLVWAVSPKMDEEAAKQAATPYSPDRTAASELVKSLVYTRDARTGICFAVGRQGSFGWKFAAVPCEMVPDDLLVRPTVAEVLKP